jgi:cobalamin biosynthesis protein CbiG
MLIPDPAVRTLSDVKVPSLERTIYEALSGAHDPPEAVDDIVTAPFDPVDNAILDPARRYGVPSVNCVNEPLNP